MVSKNKKPSIIVIGGAGHIGLPLSLCIANEGFPISIYDINKENLKKIKAGIFPYKEEGGKQLLKNVHRKLIYVKLTGLQNHYQSRRG